MSAFTFFKIFYLLKSLNQTLQVHNIDILSVMYLVDSGEKYGTVR